MTEPALTDPRAVILDGLTAWRVIWPRSIPAERGALEALVGAYATAVVSCTPDAIHQAMHDLASRSKWCPKPAELREAARAYALAPSRPDEAIPDVLGSDEWREQCDRINRALLRRIEEFLGRPLGTEMHAEPVRRGSRPSDPISRPSGFTRIGEVMGGWESRSSDRLWALMRAWEHVYRAYAAMTPEQRQALPDTKAPDWPGPTTDLGRAMLLDAAQAVADDLNRDKRVAA